MSQKPTIKVNTASKDILARAMAMEDINVIHRADAPSAYFDTKNRTLCLPVWKEMDSSVYDMLVGHEVSHALHTPAEGWQDFVGKGKLSGMRHMFLNIVEDARIERLIKDKFPGLRRDFANAYKSLNAQDLFELKNRTINLETPLIDRLNLEFKLGLFGLLDVPFSDEEKQYVTRMSETETFEEVIVLAEDLFGKHQDENPEPEQDENGESQSASGDGDEGDDSGAESGADQQDSDDQDGGSGSSAMGEEESDEDSDSQGAGDGESNGDDAGDSMEDDTDDGESAESSQTGESSDGEGDDDLSYEAYENDVNSAGSTQRNYESNIEQFRDDEASSPTYHSLPDMHLDNIIVTPKQIAEEWDMHEATDNFERYSRDHAEAIADLTSFLNGSKAVVNHMVQQFQMKQAADSDKRTNIAKTGILDTTTMINYRWSEDIFLKNEVHSDGKSHGIVIFLDWSGSMSSILNDTAEQLMILTEFCQKVNIPFEVYAFSSNRFIPGLSRVDRWSEEYQSIVDSAIGEQYTGTDEDSLKPHEFSLFNFLSSSMKSNEYKKALRRFWLTVQANNYGGRQRHSISYPRQFGLGSTPLNEAILCAIDIIPAFKDAHNLQIVNTVFLTDGDGHGMMYNSRYNNGKTILRDNKTKKTVTLNSDLGHDSETFAFLEILKQRTGCNLIGIRLHDSNHIKNLRYRFFGTTGVSDYEMRDKEFQSAVQSYKKHNCFTLENTAYDLFVVVKGNLEVVTDALENLDDDASYAKIKNAFMKGNNSKKTSRVISSKIIDVIAA